MEFEKKVWQSSQRESRMYQARFPVRPEQERKKALAVCGKSGKYACRSKCSGPAKGISCAYRDLCKISLKKGMNIAEQTTSNLEEVAENFTG